MFLGLTNWVGWSLRNVVLIFQHGSLTFGAGQFLILFQLTSVVLARGKTYVSKPSRGVNSNKNWKLSKYCSKMWISTYYFILIFILFIYLRSLISRSYFRWWRPGVAKSKNVMFKRRTSIIVRFAITVKTEENINNYCGRLR